ncbi:hypothetical protein ACLX1H_009100 [Fusarium chlamydosporum]
MSPQKGLTIQDVAEHNTSSDIYVAVHDKVYDCTQFLFDHPGGEELMLNFAGQDATEAFEDAGHSNKARDILEGLFVSELKQSNALEVVLLTDFLSNRSQIVKKDIDQMERPDQSK